MSGSLSKFEKVVARTRVKLCIVIYSYFVFITTECEFVYNIFIQGFHVYSTNKQ